MDSKKRKYVLFKADDGRPDHLKPCAFFISAEGCKNGANCRFLHEKTAAGGSSHVVETKLETKATKVSAIEESGKDKKDKKRAKRAEAESVPQKVSTKAENVVPTESEEIRLLREQVLMQQRVLEQNMAAIAKLSAKSDSTSTTTSNGNQQVPTKVTKPIAKEVKKEKISNKAVLPVASPQKPIVVARPPQPVVVAPVPRAAATKPLATHVNVAKTRYDEEEDDESDEDDSMNVDDDQEENEEESEDVNMDVDESEDDEQFLFDAVNHVIKSGANQTTPAAAEKTAPVAQPKNGKAMPVVAAAASKPAQQPKGNEDDLFVNPTTASSNAHATPVKITKKKDIFASKGSVTATTAAVLSSSQPAATADTPRAPVKLFNPAEIDFPDLAWDDLVDLTMSDSRYNTDYTFQTDYSWVKARPRVDGAAKVIAIDCEMCETADPVTGEKCGNTLIRFSVVDGHDPHKVLVDSLVNPSNPITDARTRIHGISHDAMTGAKFTLRHAQAALLNIIDEQTIMIGHSLHFDLKSLHFEHNRCIDSAYLYTVHRPEDGSKTTPGLRLVADQVLGMSLTSSHHDSAEDARTSLYAAAYYLHHDGKTPALVRDPTLTKKNHGLTRNNLKPRDNALMVHHIPGYCSEDHVQRMIVSYTNIIPQEVKPIVRGLPEASGDDAMGKTMVYFASAMHAELAFDSISGTVRQDKSNRPQKRVYLKSGGFVNVRK